MTNYIAIPGGSLSEENRRNRSKPCLEFRAFGTNLGRRPKPVPTHPKTGAKKVAESWVSLGSLVTRLGMASHVLGGTK
jgi:hypothetical protein